MATTVFDPSEGASPEQQAAETSALEQGEKIAQMQEEDRARRLSETEAANEEAALIAGKFKSQDDLLKAYKELEAKLGKDAPEEGEEPSEEEPEATEEEPVEEESSPEVFNTAATQYAEKGELTPEVIEELSKMDTKDLIQQYMEFYTKTSKEVQQKTVDAEAERSILDSVGGQESYQQMVSWASQNLDPAEVASYNEVTNSGNLPAIKFAVEALANRYKAAEGYEAPLVTGKRAQAEEKGFRSHAELSRAIADPRYNSDPAYRNDVEARLARSANLL